MPVQDPSVLPEIPKPSSERTTDVPDTDAVATQNNIRDTLHSIDDKLSQILEFLELHS